MSEVPLYVAKEADIVHSSAMSKSLKIMERMVNQNTWDEIAQVHNPNLKQFNPQTIQTPNFKPQTPDPKS